MPNLFQQLLQDIVGTQRGQSIEAKVQPTLTALTPLAQDLIAVASKNDPQLAVLISNGEAIGNAINNLGHGAAAPVSAPTGPTEADVVLIMNAALSTLGLPTTDDAAFDAAVETAYDNWKSANPT